MTDDSVKDYCERCYKHCKPEEYILFDYNNNASWLCWPCLKMIIDSLMTLPIYARTSNFQAWQARWLESEAQA
jgi:hypothetical protein